MVWCRREFNEEYVLDINGRPLYHMGNIMAFRTVLLANITNLVIIIYEMN